MLAGPAEPQPGTGAPGSQPGAAGTRIQRRWNRRHLWGLHLPAEPFWWVGVWGVKGGGGDGVSPMVRPEGLALQRVDPPHIVTPGRPGSAWPCMCCMHGTSSPSIWRPGRCTTAPSLGWSRWGWGGGDSGVQRNVGGDGKRGVVGIGEPGEVLGLGGGGDKAEGGGNLGHGGNAVGREGGMLVWGQWGPWGDRDSPAGRDAGLGTCGTPYHKAMPGDDGNRGWWVGGGPNTMGTRWDAGGG